jgi:hypothetical protein
MLATPNLVVAMSYLRAQGEFPCHEDTTRIERGLFPNRNSLELEHLIIQPTIDQDSVRT